MINTSVSHTVVTLGDLLSSAESGFACGKSKLVTNGLPHLRPFNIGRGLQLELSEQYLVPHAEAPASKRELLAGDILFNNTNSVELVGKTAFIANPVTAGFSNHLTRLRIATGRAEPEFVAHYLNYLWLKGWFSSQCVQWVNQAAFNITAIKAIKIPLPPLDEQRRIVDILNHAASIRRLREQARAKAREIIPALFVEMFGDPVTNPRGWEKAPLATLVRKGDTINYGVVQPGGDEQDGVPIVRVGDFCNGKIDVSALKKISPDIEAKYARSRLLGDEVLIACVGSIGEIALADETLRGFNIVRAVARVPLGDFADRHFIAGYLMTEYAQSFFRSETRTVAQPTLNIKQIKETPVLLPPIELQKEFAERFAEMEGISTLNERAATAAEQMAQSLLAQVFGQAA